MTNERKPKCGECADAETCKAELATHGVTFDPDLEAADCFQEKATGYDRATVEACIGKVRALDSDTHDDRIERIVVCDALRSLLTDAPTATTEEEVEKVARAIHEADHMSPDLCGGDVTPWGALNNRWTAHYHQLARAAIRAMGERP
jgi:hypothetical protein